MNKHLRTILFTGLGIVFIAIAPVIIFYSQGYRYDFQKNQLLLTGGMYVKTSQPAADVYIDNKFTNKTGQILSYDFLVQNLLPKTHNIRIEKAGYLSWQKNLTVKEKMVAQAYVNLFPQRIDFASAEQNIKQIFSFPGYNKIFFLDQNNYLFSSEAGQKALLLGTASSTINKILDITLSEDTSRIILKTTEKTTNKTKYYLLPTDKETTTLTALKNLDKTTSRIFFYSNNIIFFDLNQKIYKESLDVQKTTLVNQKTVTAFNLQGDSLFILQDKLLQRQNVITSLTEALVKEPITINPKSSYEIISYWNKVFILENKKILSVVTEDQQLKNLITSDSEIKFNGFFDKIALYNDSSLWLYLLKDYETPFFAKTDSLVLINKYNRINDFSWIGGEYFALLDNNNQTQISEVDNRDKINTFTAYAPDATRVWFDQNSKKLYILSQNNLLLSSKLIP